MSDAIQVDAPELRMLAQLAGVRPDRFAAALNDPDRFSEFISADELFRYLAAIERLMPIISRINSILTAGFEKAKEKAHAR